MAAIPAGIAAASIAIIRNRATITCAPLGGIYFVCPYRLHPKGVINMSFYLQSIYMGFILCYIDCAY